MSLILLTKHPHKKVINFIPWTKFLMAFFATYVLVIITIQTRVNRIAEKYDQQRRNRSNPGVIANNNVAIIDNDHMQIAPLPIPDTLNDGNKSLKAEPHAATVIVSEVGRDKVHYSQLLDNLYVTMNSCPFILKYPILIYQTDEQPRGRTLFVQDELISIARLFTKTNDDVNINVIDVSHEFHQPGRMIATMSPNETEYEYYTQSPKPAKLDLWGLKYRHMIRFKVKLLWERPEIQRLQYVLQLDSDSIWEDCPKGYDPLEIAVKHQIDYGFRQVSAEPMFVVQQLCETVQSYVKIRHIQSLMPIAWNKLQNDCRRKVDFPKFISSVGIVSVKFMKQPDVWEFVNFIDYLGGIFRYRWGDSPIRYLEITLFSECKRLLLLTEGTYWHQGRMKASQNICFRRDMLSGNLTT